VDSEHLSGNKKIANPFWCAIWPKDPGHPVSDVNKCERSFISAGRDLCPLAPETGAGPFGLEQQQLRTIPSICCLWWEKKFRCLIDRGKLAFCKVPTLVSVGAFVFLPHFRVFPFQRFFCLGHLRFSSCCALSCVSFVCFDRRGDRRGLIVKGLHIRSCHHR
jgi:hypothetical protein